MSIQTMGQASRFILSVLLLAVVGAGIWYRFYFVPPTEITSEWKSYVNSELNVSFEYPTSWGDVVLVHRNLDLSECVPSEFSHKTYFPSAIAPSDVLNFTARPDYIDIGLTGFNESSPEICVDGQFLTKISERKESLFTPNPVVPNFNIYGQGTFKTEQGYPVFYYPNLFNALGSAVVQDYEVYGPQVVVQGWLIYRLTAHSPELLEAEKQYNGNLTTWVREGHYASSLRQDLFDFDRLMKTFKFIDNK